MPAVDPDTRGATTIREQLDKHRNSTSLHRLPRQDRSRRLRPGEVSTCSAAGATTTARSGDGEGHEQGIGKNGQPFDFHDGPAVDASGAACPTAAKFADVRELKRLLLADERQIARNLAQQLVVYATGAPVRFGDRAESKQILDRAAPTDYGVRSLVHEIVQSDLFPEQVNADLASR